MLKFILWPTNGIKRQQVEHIGMYNNLAFYALRDETDPYSLAFVEISDGYLVPALGINRCEQVAVQLGNNPLAYVTAWFNDNLNSDYKVSVGVAEYLNRLPEAIEHNNRIEAIERQQEQAKAAEEQRQREANERALREIRERELVKASQAFIAGKTVPAKDFVDLCKKHNVIIPLKTLGWCMKSLAHIKKDGYTCYHGSNKSTVIYNYVDKLLAAMGECV